MNQSAEFTDLLRRTGQQKNLAFFESQLKSEEQGAVAKDFFARSHSNPLSVLDIYAQAAAADPAKTTDLVFEFEEDEINHFCSSIVSEDHPGAPNWKDAGLQAILRKECAVCILAGGQGSRLFTDSATPKGCFVLPLLPSKRSLFQTFAEKVQCTEYMAFMYAKKHFAREDIPKIHIPVVILTSEENHCATIEFFETNMYFGLEDHQIFFVPQGMLPALQIEDGFTQPEFIFKSRTEISFAPSGNGALFRALKASGVFEKLRKSGVRYLQISPVDNPLTVMADPTFFGFCMMKQLDVCCKCFRIPATEMGKAVGVFANDDDRWSVCEYFEVDDKLKSKASHKEGSFALANMATYCISMDFCEAAHSALSSETDQRIPHHIARKRIPSCQSPDGHIDGMKMESFIHDTFPLANFFGLFVVDRKTHFAPVKRPDPLPVDQIDLRNVEERTPMAARMALLRNDLLLLPPVDRTVIDELLLDREWYSVESDLLVPFLTPEELLKQVDTDED